MTWIAATSRIRLSLVTCTLMLAAGAFTAGSASAAEWFINKTALKGTAALDTTAALDSSFAFVSPVAQILVLCTGGTSDLLLGTKPQIESPNKASAERFTFMGCSLMQPAECSVQEEIGTEPVTITVKTGTSSGDQVLLTPQFGSL